MRILFLERNSVWTHGLPNGFCDAGHDVCISGPIINSPEGTIARLIQKYQPDLIFSIGWGTTNDSIPKQNRLSNEVTATGIPHVYWATEDPTHHISFTLPLLTRVKPHFIFTLNNALVNDYAALGINAAHLDFGYHPTVHSPRPPAEEYQHKIAIVASAYPHVLSAYPDHYRLTGLSVLLRPLLDAGMRVDFYGHEWAKMGPFLGREIPSEWNHGYLPYVNAASVYSSSEIIIALQNRPDQLTQRTYEAMASGAFLLTSDTPAIRKNFQSGHNLVTSSSPEETLQLVNYYLNDPEQYQKIRQNALNSIHEFHYKYKAEYVLETLQNAGIFDGKQNDYCHPKIQELLHRKKKNGYYVSQLGDTWTRIADELGVNPSELIEWNQVTSVNRTIFPGSKIKMTL